MLKEKESKQMNSDPAKEPFVTIDDLVVRADELATGLRVLSEYKHPLKIRRGVKRRGEVSEMADEGFGAQPCENLRCR